MSVKRISINRRNLKKDDKPKLEWSYETVSPYPEISEEMIEKVLKYLLFCLKNNNQ